VHCQNLLVHIDQKASGLMLVNQQLHMQLAVCAPASTGFNGIDAAGRGATQLQLSRAAAA
jgi:hypothetical protein